MVSDDYTKSGYIYYGFKKLWEIKSQKSKHFVCEYHFLVDVLYWLDVVHV